MRIRDSLWALLGLAAIALQPALGEEIRDYYSEPGINPFKETLNQNFNEHIDPFSGTLQLKYTDIHVPGNGGMDININRTYTSLQTNQYPTLNINGLGWTMHYGRVVVPRAHLSKMCNQTIYNANTADNPSLEMPDGGRELLVLNGIHNDDSMITRSNWRAQCSAQPGILVTAPDGTRYTMDRFDNFRDEPSWLPARCCGARTMRRTARRSTPRLRPNAPPTPASSTMKSRASPTSARATSIRRSGGS
jgi:hypothetical protein